MKILLTNDDGINSDGIQKMAACLRSVGKHKVTVVAPVQNRSAVSQAITVINEPVKIVNLGEDNWSCSGTPSDCVIAALKGDFCEKPDLVLSGINQGANLGTDIIFSGTAAAARQASLYGVPAIALSLKTRELFHWDMAASWVLEHLDELIEFWRENTFVNVNIPNRPEGPLGILTSWPGIKHYNDTLSVKKDEEGSLLCSLSWGKESVVYEAGSDLDVVSRNYVSVSTLNNFSVVIRDCCPGAPDYAAVAARS